MSDTNDSNSPNNAAVSATAGLAEIERLIGTARAAASEAAVFQQAAAKSATEAELDRTKAAEHLREIEAKRDLAVSEVVTIQARTQASAASSSTIDDVAKFADESRAKIDLTLKQIIEREQEIEARAKTAGENSTGIQSVIIDLTSRHSEIGPVVQEINDLRTKVSEAAISSEKARDETSLLRDSTKISADAAAVSCKNVEDGKIYIDGERSKIESFASDANSRLGEATKAATGAQESVAAINSLQTNAIAALTEITLTATEIKQTKAAAESDRQATEKLASTAGSIQVRVDAYENELRRLTAEYDSVQKKIESLLPGAASAGLAHAFHKQKGNYNGPRYFWNGAFFFALAGLLTIGIVEIVHHWSEPSPEYSQLLRSLLSRLPIVVALIWLALHAGNKVRIANQIQEDYAFKEVVSQPFEGYKKEFAALEQNVGPESPLGTLCSSVVSIIAATPSRVYDKHSSDPTPLSHVAEAAKNLATAIKDIKIPVKSS